MIDLMELKDPEVLRLVHASAEGRAYSVRLADARITWSVRRRTFLPHRQWKEKRDLG